MKCQIFNLNCLFISYTYPNTLSYLAQATYYQAGTLHNKVKLEHTDVTALVTRMKPVGPHSHPASSS